MIAWWSLAWVWLAGVVGMLAVWLYAQQRRNAGYVDVAWAAHMTFMGAFVAAMGHGAALPRILLAAMLVTWGLRLTLHLFGRVHGRPEDGRYAHLRMLWKGRDLRFLPLFEAQAIVVTAFAVPIAVAASNPVAHVTPWTIAAIAVWVLAVAGESLADRQLAAWVADPANRGKTCRRGLWASSRHPNYFFEWLHWFAYALLAAGAPMAWLALLGPLLMFVFLYRITGIPWTEAQSLRSRGDDYLAYQREVSAFFPWPPRRST